MTALEIPTREFAIGLRGYDRAQVDEYIEYLHGRLAAAEGRAQEAEGEYVFDEHAKVGPRVAEIFALAEAEARELRERVRTQSSAMIADAQAEAEAILEAAERQAVAVRGQAERDHVVMLSSFDRDRERARDEVAALERRKAEAIAELNRLREMLGQAAGMTEPVADHQDHARETPLPLSSLHPDAPTEVIAVKRETIESAGETVELPVISEIDEA